MLQFGYAHFKWSRAKAAAVCERVGFLEIVYGNLGFVNSEHYHIKGTIKSGVVWSSFCCWETDEITLSFVPPEAATHTNKYTIATSATHRYTTSPPVVLYVHWRYRTFYTHLYPYKYVLLCRVFLIREPNMWTIHNAV